MGSKSYTVFVCHSCGYQTPKWMGRCPDCGQWDSLVETREQGAKSSTTTPGSHLEPKPIKEILISPNVRIITHIKEFDRILGGGIVYGSIILIGGEPGIGKSTLMLQVMDHLALSGMKVLYVTGEESTQQVKMRASRLGISSDNLYVLAVTSIEECLDKVQQLGPSVITVDSIQTMYTEQMSTAAGTVGQVREVAAQLTNYAKSTNAAVFLIGHVTKEGAIAGPKILEHLVDTVLYFEGDSNHTYRILRSVKNRYGSTNEIGVFEMRDTGLVEVNNPSYFFLQQRPKGESGSVVIPCLEGTRPVLLEVQALVSPSPFGVPRRTCIGVDPNRISLLVAVLGKRLGLELGDQDIFVNVTGGLRIEEPASDLGLVAALISSFLNHPVSPETTVFGEVGLGGEVRGVNRPVLRLKEAARLGFAKCIIPRSSINEDQLPQGISASEVTSIQDLYEVLFS